MSTKWLGSTDNFTIGQKIFAGIFWMILCLAVLAYCNRSDRSNSPSAEEKSALSKMAAVFQGNHSEAEISAALLPLMNKQNVRPDENELQRWGSVLVRMRKNSGISEMEIMRCMRGIPGMPFPENVAMCGTLQEKLRR